MGLFTRLSSHFSRRPVIALTNRDIDQITDSAHRASTLPRIEVLHNTLALDLPNAEKLKDVLEASGYVTASTGFSSFTVLGWRPTPGQGLTVAEIDERLDLLLRMRQQAEAANHLTHTE